jgi:ATPase subunit of ABC transporter with duplicated ATPase domains
MSILSVNQLAHGFAGKTLFKEVSFRLMAGERVGLVGANGVGKSTLMNILTGQLQSEHGEVEWMNKVRVGYLDQHAKLTSGMSIRQVLQSAFQHLFDLEQELHEITAKMSDADADLLEVLLEQMGDIQEKLDLGDFYLLDAKIEEVAAGIGLNAVGLERDVSELSGGQRTKVLLAKLLLEKPTALLLDEPTNYLDVEHIDWLTDYLQHYPYSFILISHDTEFMNQVVTVIYHLEAHKLTRYTANYEQFLAMAEMKRNQYADQYERQQEQISKMEDFIQRNKARASTSGRAKSRMKQLDRIERMDRPETLVRPTFSFKEARASSRYVTQCTQLQIGYNRPLLPALTMNLERGQKVAIIGCNGVGKSTLLKTIMGKIEPLDGRSELGDYLFPAYFEQEVRARDITPIEDVWDEYPQMTQAEVRAALARCGLTNEHITRKMSSLSGGEQAKVRLCKLMMRESNWLVLDEPTNHLDVMAKEELQKALIQFKGTILLVCHEPEFYEGWITDVWNVEQWSMQLQSSVKS